MTSMEPQSLSVSSREPEGIPDLTGEQNYGWIQDMTDDRTEDRVDSGHDGQSDGGTELRTDTGHD